MSRSDKGCLQPRLIASAASAVPASWLSLVTFDLPQPFRSGARSGDTELSSLLGFGGGELEKNFPPNQVDLDSTRSRGSVGLSSFTLDCQLCIVCGVKKSCSHWV